MKRRRFVRRTMTAVLAAAVPIELYAWRVEPEWLDVVERPLPVAGLPADLEGRTLAHLSDLHVGTADTAFLHEAFRRTRELEPDFVVCTGDWITASAPGAVDLLREMLPAFPRGRLGTVGSLGNHDFGNQWRMGERADAITEASTDAGISMLRNEAIALEGLQFVGLDDLWSGRFAPERAFRRTDPEASTIVLSHNPDTADLPGLAGVRGWILAGHTHGGQCRPPFLPPPVLPVRNRRYTSGSFDLGGGRWMYISRGLGYVMRVRLNVRPEVTLFRLARA